MSTDKQAFSGVEACVFDAYGTLFDFGAAARKCVATSWAGRHRQADNSLARQAAYNTPGFGLPKDATPIFGRLPAMRLTIHWKRWRSICPVFEIG